ACASSGRRTRLHFGTTAARNTMRCGIITPTDATAIASRCVGRSRTDEDNLAHIRLTRVPGLGSTLAHCTDLGAIGAKRTFHGRFNEEKNMDQERRDFLQNSARVGGFALASAALGRIEPVLAQSGRGHELGTMTMVELSQLLASQKITGRQLVEQALAAIKDPQGEGS